LWLWLDFVINSYKDSWTEFRVGGGGGGGCDDDDGGRVVEKERRWGAPTCRGNRCANRRSQDRAVAAAAEDDADAQDSEIRQDGKSCTGRWYIFNNITLRCLPLPLPCIMYLSVCPYLMKQSKAIRIRVIRLKNVALWQALASG
jgi:hypothetical protein